MTGNLIPPMVSTNFPHPDIKSGRDRVTKHEIEINDYEYEDPYHETVWEKSICEEVFPEEVD